MAAEPGTIVILNGAAGAGKSSIARALQAELNEPLLEAGIDRFLAMLPGRYMERPLWDDVLGRFDSAGSIGHALVIGMHRAIAELSRSGWSVVADHVMVDAAWVRDAASRLADLPAYFVGVRCPLDVLVRRERERTDRQATLGEAERQFPVVHAHATYDLELDTSRLTAAECAARISAYIETQRPAAFLALATAA